MPENAGKDALAVQSVERVGIRVADARGHDFDQDFALLRTVEIEFDNFQRFLRFKGDGGARFHTLLPRVHVCVFCRLL